MSVEITPELLDRVADAIEQYGWTQGTFYDADGFCLLGGFNWVAFGDSDAFNNSAVAQRHFAYALGYIHPSMVVAYNDYLLTTKEKVVHKLRKAAERKRKVEVLKASAKATVKATAKVKVESLKQDRRRIRRELTNMNIGREVKTHIIKPVQAPVPPQREPVRRREPSKPAAPRVPEKVPSK